MRIVIVFNPIAGAGKTANIAQSLEQALTTAKHDVSLLPSRLDPCQTWLDPIAKGAQLLVVVGGDGAVRQAAPSAMRADIPLYHAPAGTENLFSREFGMTRDPAVLLAAIDQSRTTRVDVGDANGETFLLMASMGYDAEVVHDLAGCRGKRITHRTYIMPCVRQLWRWRPATMTIRVEGKAVVQDESGAVVVANSRQYAWRLDPARGASMTDGLLDVIFMPMRSRLGLATWLGKVRTGRHTNDRRLVAARGQEIEIQCQQPQRYQLDGDPPAECVSKSTVNDLKIRIHPAALPVLLP